MAKTSKRLKEEKTSGLALALDVHGGDFGPGVTIPAALDVLADNPGLEVLLCGIPAEIESVLQGLGIRSDAQAQHKRLSIVEASLALAPDARPVAALRRGRGSSLWLALEQVSSGRASACVSAGSTAAILALGVKLLGMLPGIERPALMSRVPSASGHTNLLDLGANLHVSANQLVQFAIMGYVTCALENSQEDPVVALLNVGHEDSKGDSVIREAHAMLKELPINYSGFIEGHDIFAGKADVAVCDGFAGNLIVKSGEGLAAMIFQHLEQAMSQGVAARLGSMLVARRLKSILARFEPSKHNGAPLLGLRGVVMKSHGYADRGATGQAIAKAVLEAKRQVPQKIESMINDYSIEVSS
jgi:glycerol-3-phosphate acyltransferase PlsX